MANIFDHMDDSGDFSQPSNSEGEQFTIQFGVESTTLKVVPNLRVRDAFSQKASFLGFSTDRRLTYRDNENNLLSGEEPVQAGRIYTASITHDEKGR